MYNVTLKHIRATTATAGKKPTKYYIIWVHVCSINYPQRKAHVPYYMVKSVACLALALFPHYLMQRVRFSVEKKVTERKLDLCLTVHHQM